MLTLKQIAQLKKNGITNLPHLALLVAADEPKTFKQLQSEVGLSIRAIERMLERGTDLFKVVTYKEERGYMEGRPASRALLRTAKGSRLLKSVG